MDLCAPVWLYCGQRAARFPLGLLNVQRVVRSVVQRVPAYEYGCMDGDGDGAGDWEFVRLCEMQVQVKRTGQGSLQDCTSTLCRVQVA